MKPVFILLIILPSVCRGLETCKVFPSSNMIKYGSDVTVFLRAPPNSQCRKKTGFDNSRVYWTLEGRRIAEGSCHSNSTFASVSIPTFSLQNGTVECHMDGIVLGGTFIRTYTIPQNVSCTAKKDGPSSFSLTCTWDHDQHNLKTTYTLRMKQGSRVESCQSEKKSCTITDGKGPLISSPIHINVMATNDAGEARSENVFYDGVWLIVQVDAPIDIQVRATESSGLKVTWIIKPEKYLTECEVRWRGTAGSGSILSEKCNLCSSLELRELEPCTNYTLSVRCRIEDAIWSAWSQNVTRLTSLNVSSAEFHLWRSESVMDDAGKRATHLMWKGISPSCEVFDKYCLFDHTHNLTRRCFKPSVNHTFITLDEDMHRLSVAAFHNNRNLKEVSIEIPSTAEDLKLPPVGNISKFARDGQMHMTWERPDLAVSGYIIVWNSSKENHLWEYTQETNFTLKGEDLTLYTISLTPLYESGPGSEVRFHYYTREGEPAVVSGVKVDEISDRKAKIHWQRVLPTECCAFVVSYSVIFEARNDKVPQNVTVDQNQHSVILDTLQPNTAYSVYIRANSVTYYSKSNRYMFSTKSYGNFVLNLLIVCGVVLMLLPVCTVLLVLMRRAYLSEKVPNPRFSSLSIWSSQKCQNHWNQLPMPWGCDTEKFLACRVEAEDSISVTSTDVAKLLACAAEQKTMIQETTAEAENAALVSSSIEPKLATEGKEERTQPLPPVDLPTARIHPVPGKSPYRNQTAQASPADSPNKSLQGTTNPHASGETKTHLKPKLQNVTPSTTYVTVDMFEQDKNVTASLPVNE